MSFILPEIVVPPGGWDFRQPELNWQIENPLEINRNQAAEQLSMIRRANPRFNLNSDLAQCLLEIEQAAYQRLQRILPLAERHKYFFDPPDDQKKTLSGLQSSPNQRNLLQRVADFAAASGNILRDWEPVASAVSTSRASRCLNCSLNQNGDWVTQAASRVGSVIREYVAIKKQMQLTVPDEDKLGSCSACECAIPLKVHVPIDRIPMDAELKTRLEQAKDVETGEPLKCWIISSKEALTS